MQALQQIDNDYNIQERTLGLAISQGVHPAMLQHIGQEELLQPEYLDTHLENIVQELTVSLR